MPDTLSCSRPSPPLPVTSVPTTLLSQANIPARLSPMCLKPATPSSATLRPPPRPPVDSLGAPQPTRGTPCLSPMRPSLPSPSLIAPRSSQRSTSSRPPRPVKRESLPSTDSVSLPVPSVSVNNIVNKSSAPIRPAHSISDYNRHDFTRSAVPGSVYNLHVRY